MLRSFLRPTSVVTLSAALVILISGWTDRGARTRWARATSAPCDSATVVEIGHRAIISQLGASMESFKPFVAIVQHGEWVVRGKKSKAGHGPVARIGMDSCTVINVIYTL